MEEADRLVLADAQTNGGMLAAVAPGAAERLLRKLADAGVPAERIGEVVPRGRKEPGVTVEGALQG
jgi:selenophosphate synthase